MPKQFDKKKKRWTVWVLYILFVPMRVASPKTSRIHGRAKWNIAKYSHKHTHTHMYTAIHHKSFVMVRRAEVSNVYLIVSWNFGSPVRWTEKAPSNRREAQKTRQYHVSQRHFWQSFYEITVSIAFLFSPLYSHKTFDRAKSMARSHVECTFTETEFSIDLISRTCVTHLPAKLIFNFDDGKNCEID